MAPGREPETDQDFDAVAESFEGDVYGSSKGLVRLAVLREDLFSAIPELGDGGLSVLDAGGGAGRVALLLAEAGNRVLLADPSREMLARAERAFAGSRHAAGGSVATVRSSIQDLREHLAGERFDVVCCHAVLEWLADPRGVLGNLVGFPGPQGRLSLMFYNRNAALLKRALEGDLGLALGGDVPRRRGWGEGATPLAEDSVQAWLGRLGLRVRSKAGIRILHDHVPEDLRRPERIGELLEAEKRLRGREPFASLGQHTHLVCERSGA
jgi:S-adenosylmethionine-dependent methyltransferase